MFLARFSAIAVAGLSLGGCVAVAPTGYWDARLAELPLAYNFGCRAALDEGIPQDATNYCPRDMPLPPNGVWKPGLAR